MDILLGNGGSIYADRDNEGIFPETQFTAMAASLAGCLEPSGRATPVCSQSSRSGDLSMATDATLELGEPHSGLPRKTPGSTSTPSLPHWPSKWEMF